MDDYEFGAQYVIVFDDLMLCYDVLIWHVINEIASFSVADVGSIRIRCGDERFFYLILYLRQLQRNCVDVTSSPFFH